MDLVAFLSPAPCASFPALVEKRGAEACGSRTGFLDRVSQPRNCADAHPVATVWDRRQVAGTGTGAKLMLKLYYFSWVILTGANTR